MKRISQTVVAAVGMALAGSAFAARYVADDPYYFDYARVMRVDRVVAQDNQPVTREECWQEPLNEGPDTNYRENTPARIVESTRVSNDGVVRSNVVRVETVKKD